MATAQLLAAASAVPGPQQAFVGAASFLSGLLPKNKKDAERVARAQSELAKALAGDAAALLWIQQQAGVVPGYGSATEVGREAYRRALAAYNAQRGSFASPVAPPTPFQQQVSTTVAQVRQDIAQGFQNIGAGATTAAADTISGGSRAVTIPLNRNQLVLFAVLAGALIWLRR